jgi:3D-(3,5/4)-trihydroxycyclohexane-1,2-dione acylhydrolase (decyclizing)
LSQGEVVGLLNQTLGPRDIIVNAAGSLPGDLHKLWRTRDAKGYHMDYGYSCMGYEVAGGLGVKMADPSREVYVLIGDGSYLMMAQEIVTSLQEKIKLNIVVFDNHGFSSIGGLSRHVGSGGFGTEYRYREEGLTGPVMEIDFAANAASLGAHSIKASTYEEFAAALAEAKKQTRTSVVVVETDYHDRVPGYESWWDVPIAEVSESAEVKQARAIYVEAMKKERYFWPR